MQCSNPVPLLTPEEDYEINGDVNNVLFPTGACILDNKLFVYYGAADKVCCVATADYKRYWIIYCQINVLPDSNEKT
jgi:predicted GH43/DUF377 family glycosyl hydrolase